MGIFSIFRLLARFFLKGLVAALEFCIEHWKVVVPAIASLMLILYINSLHSTIAAKDKLHKDYVDGIQEQSRQREKENAAKDLASQRKANELQAKHAKQLADLNLDRDKAAKQLKDDLNAKILNRDMRLSSYADRVRIDAAKAETSAGLRDIQLSAEGRTEIGGDCDAANRRLETAYEACAITTIDYNNLYDAWMAECEIKGCK